MKTKQIFTAPNNLLFEVVCYRNGFRCEYTSSRDYTVAEVIKEYKNLQLEHIGKKNGQSKYTIEAVAKNCMATWNTSDLDFWYGEYRKLEKEIQEIEKI